ncbi:Autophagy protein 5 [Cyberlindnera fabianii]|uniref:Autophagy protein 5 n=1 Tax=Cyberlindnera fabianii TaxID=36022 RepID=A0A1V2L2D0_CYBFA|nr:Autophagy protein 5 [Cyberlindnera fabianii]
MACEIRELLWNGTIPCTITLYPNDSNQMTNTYEYHVLAPRNSYFPTLYPELLSYFKPYLLVPEWSHRSDWWLEFEGVPLRWNWPVGVLYDTMTGIDPSKGNKRSPWKLILRYRSYPDDYLLALPTLETLKTHWMNQIKESCYVQHGTAKPVMVLSKNDSSDLWSSVETHDFKQFWSIFMKIAPKTVDKLKHVPSRFYITVSDKVIDLPFSPLNPSSEEPQTLGSVLHELLPDLFPSSKNYILAKPVLHGIVIPSNTLVGEIYFDAVYVDGFLHFAIIPVV